MKFKKLFSVICSFTMMISSIFCCKADPADQRVVFLGAEGVGKTQIVNRWVYDSFENIYSQTIDAAFVQKTIGADLYTQIFDTAGAERFRSILSAYCRSASIAVIVADLTNDESINGISEFIEVVKNTDPDEKILLVGNKADLMESKSLDLIQQLNKLRNKAIEHDLNIDDKDIIAVSAKSGDGIDVLENRIIEILQNLPPQNNGLTESTSDTRNIGTSNKYSKYLTGAGLVALIAGTGLLIKKHFTSNDTQKNESL